MRIHSVTFRLTSCLVLLLITLVTVLTTTWVQADDAIRKGTSEKTKSISAAMESSLEGLPKLCESVSKSIVRVETEDNDNLTGVIVSSGGHIVVGNVVNYWMMDEHDTPRRSGFAAVFDTDIELLQREVGCPVIDVEGRIRGIAIASRGRDETQRGPTSVLPSRIVSRVTKQLMAKASSN